MRDFKKIKAIGKCVLFFAILVSILLGLSAKMQTICLKNDNLVQDRNKSTFRIQREGDDTIDVAIIGDSLSYSSFSPMEMWNQKGISSYVCGQSGQKIEETYSMLETVFQAQSPKVVVLETDVLFRGDNQLSISSLKDSLNEFMNQHFSILRCHDIWKSYITGKRYPDESYKGFIFRCVVTPYKYGEYMIETDQKATIPEEVLNYMEKIQNLCSKNNAKLLLVSAPSPVNYDYSKHNAIAAYAEENNLAYLDLNLQQTELGVDWTTDSIDAGDHLNLFGALKVSKYMGDYLKAEYKLTDHRNEKKYTSWNTSLTEYTEKRDEHLKVMNS